ncbi:16S rRNA (cytosine(1402)-N(4))-methyltransferase RsmH [Salibacterium halotolerans]|uniref:Ribosomal RNA small subunit methyltransferase H n=1 Tax=Salibacterium halotolerans TaxID=1884432 RepID=A0A1I5M4B2_9BACI|nr:16S rRNA (cytosine(1402)-N(4))-methyltransferase RsmH [Salibacterium halotolerans]SFP04333.1 16S rRNA (cytosine1402-N4)-methyltransferase [Salibacterium halotolerans]
METFRHDTVLLEEAVGGLAVHPSGMYADCTLGAGGHSERIAAELGESGRLYAFEQDETALKHAKERLAPFKERITFIHDNFSALPNVAEQEDVPGMDGILFDLGVSSPQFDEPTRGFSYRFDAPLDMRMDKRTELTADIIVNEWSFQKLYEIIAKYGEEKFAKQIARKIEERRKQTPIHTTYELNECIKEGIPAPARRTGGHPSKRTFQALRIAVNDELNVFEATLRHACKLLQPGGRLCVITFHSLEDKICKRIFKEKSTLPDLPKGLPVIPEGMEPELELITKKPITADDAELQANNRAHSAKLRIAEKKMRGDSVG